MLSRYSSIFAALVLMFVVSAASAQFNMSSVVLVLFFMLVAVSGVYVASGSKRHAKVSAASAIVWVALLWLHNRLGTFELSAASSVAGLLYIGLTLWFMLRHIFRSEKVHADLLFGAAAVYLMFALMWTLIYNTIEIFFPGSFGVDEQDFFSLLYFSLTTLTTLGYGDISPHLPLARIAAVLEAVVGVLYTAILVARLLGLHLTGSSASRENKS